MHTQSSPTRLIPLSRGLWMLVDATDYERIGAVQWSAGRNPDDEARYAIRTVYIPRRRTEYAHRIIMGLPPGRTPQVDHINRDTLDNRRANLRICNRDRNVHNTGLRVDNTSGFKGVSWHLNKTQWQVRITDHGRRHSLGYFNDPIEAAHAYDTAAIRLHGEFARLNFPLHV